MLSGVILVTELIGMRPHSPALLSTVALLIGALLSWPAAIKRGFIWFLFALFSLLGTVTILRAPIFSLSLGSVAKANITAGKLKGAATPLPARVAEGDASEEKIAALMALPIIEFDRQYTLARADIAGAPREMEIAAERLLRSRLATLRRDLSSAKRDYTQCADEVDSLERAGKVRERELLVSSVRCKAAKEALRGINNGR